MQKRAGRQKPQAAPLRWCSAGDLSGLGRFRECMRCVPAKLRDDKVAYAEL